MNLCRCRQRTRLVAPGGGLRATRGLRLGPALRSGRWLPRRLVLLLLAREPAQVRWARTDRRDDWGLLCAEGATMSERMGARCVPFQGRSGGRTRLFGGDTFHVRLEFGDFVVFQAGRRRALAGIPALVQRSARTLPSIFISFASRVNTNGHCGPPSSEQMLHKRILLQLTATTHTVLWDVSHGRQTWSRRRKPHLALPLERTTQAKHSPRRGRVTASTSRRYAASSHWERA